MNKINADGNCLFRAIAQAYYGDQEQHEVLREKVAQCAIALSYMNDWEKGYWSKVIPSDVDIKKAWAIDSIPKTVIDASPSKRLRIWATGMRRPGIWGDLSCIYLLSEVLYIDIRVVFSGHYSHIPSIYVSSPGTIWTSEVPIGGRWSKAIVLDFQTTKTGLGDHYELLGLETCPKPKVFPDPLFRSDLEEFH